MTGFTVLPEIEINPENVATSGEKCSHQVLSQFKATLFWFVGLR